MTLRAWTFFLVVRGQLVMEFPGGRTSGWVADFGSDVKERVTWPLARPENPYGCNGTDTIGSDAMLIVKRGECQFAEKAAFAKALGAAGLIVIDDVGSTSPLLMSGDGVNYTFPIIGVPYRKSVFEDATANSCTAWLYVPPIVDPSEIILVLFATALVAFGAFFSITDLHKSPLVSAPPEVVVVGGLSALLFVAMGSCSLIVLFFFMHYAIYVLLFAFCIGGTSSFQQMLEPVVAHYIPPLRAKVGCGAHLSDIIAVIPAVALTTMFMIYRNDDQLGWIFQDAIAVGFLCQIQKALRLPSIKIATITLVLLFFFDIFWVFISPMLFQKSVMIEVAKGGGTGESVPMLLKIPVILDDLPNHRMLGFGDVALPGLLVSYLLRHDIVSKRSWQQGYFWPVVAAYLVGLASTLVVLRITQMGQPALLYLVPACLGTTLVLGYKRNDMTNLWRGLDAEHDRELQDQRSLFLSQEESLKHD
eukprot:GEMP01011816.1.p1 GENE.GEMP01011816.1~~GEMP01011816.1.p1  ORF type:complete len:475 (+),score=68.75 GEMP01011816.1:94-1518(+)